MKKLIGWDKSLKSEAARIAGELSSNRPYAQFSIIGERRSGRTTFFQCLAQHINAAGGGPSDLIVFADELKIKSDGTLVTAFHEALARSVEISGVGGAVNCTLTAQELLQVDALFLLASKVIDNMQRTPVFLIDMGAALESGDDSSVLELARVLKWVYNSSRDRNIPFSLGLGWTKTFFDRAVVIAGDVFRDRFRPRRELGNSFESEAPFETFNVIVKNIAGVEIPARFAGLLRVPGLTAGMYGENLRGLKAKGEVSPTLAWEALRAEWEIIPQLAYPEISNLSSADLAELLLADGRLSDNRCPQYVERAAANSFGANDKLYERFGLLPPRRDPTIRERFRNRLNDPEDSALVAEIAKSMSQALEEVCQAEIHETRILPGRSAVITATLEQLPPALADESQGYPELDQNFDEKALPKKLTIGIYLDSPDSSEFEKELSAGLKRGDFLMVCYRQGVLQPITGTELFRSAKNDGSLFSVFETTEDELCTLTNRATDKTPCDTMIVSQVIHCLSDHLSRRPAIPLLAETGKKALAAIIAGAGRLKVEDLKTNLDLSNADCAGIISRLQGADIVTKKKNVLYWDPAQDPLLRALLGAAHKSEKLIVDLREKFTLSDSPLDPQEILVAYFGVFQGAEFSMIKEDDLLIWYEAHRPQLLNAAEHVISSDKDLASFKERAQLLQAKKLTDLQDIAGDRQEIEALLAEASEKLDKINISRVVAAKELQQAKDSLKKSIEDHSSCFEELERDEMLSQIEGFRSTESAGMTQMRRKLEKRIGELEAVRKALHATKERLKELKEEAGDQFDSKSDQIFDTADKLLNVTDTASLTPKLVELNKSIDEVQRNLLRTKVIAISRHPTDLPLKGLDAEPPSVPGLNPPPFKLPDPPKRGGQKAVEIPTKPLAVPTIPPCVAAELKEDVFDISNPDQAKKLAELLQSPKIVIKRIHAAFQ
jgi:hypothetical protein